MLRTSALAALRERVRLIEQGGGRHAAGTLPFGLFALDRRLPDGGLPRGALHDITGDITDEGYSAAATLFAAAL